MVAGSRKAASPPFDVLVATGLREELPDVPGLAARSGLDGVALPLLPRLGGYASAALSCSLLDQCQCTRLCCSIS